MINNSLIGRQPEWQIRQRERERKMITFMHKDIKEESLKMVNWIRTDPINHIHSLNLIQAQWRRSHEHTTKFASLDKNWLCTHYTVQCTVHATSINWIICEEKFAATIVKSFVFFSYCRVVWIYCHCATVNCFSLRKISTYHMMIRERAMLVTDKLWPISCLRSADWLSGISPWDLRLWLQMECVC